MKLKMLKTKNGRDDNSLEVLNYKAGDVYDFGPDLAKVFLDMGVAEIFEIEITKPQAKEKDIPAAEPAAEPEKEQINDEKGEREVPEEKKIEPAAENKMLDQKTENKAAKNKNPKKKGGKK